MMASAGQRGWAVQPSVQRLPVLSSTHPSAPRSQPPRRPAPPRPRLLPPGESRPAHPRPPRAAPCRRSSRCWRLPRCRGTGRGGGTRPLPRAGPAPARCWPPPPRPGWMDEWVGAGEPWVESRTVGGHTRPGQAGGREGGGQTRARRPRQLSAAAWASSASAVWRSQASQAGRMQAHSSAGPQLLACSWDASANCSAASRLFMRGSCGVHTPRMQQQQQCHGVAQWPGGTRRYQRLAAPLPTTPLCEPRPSAPARGRPLFLRRSGRARGSAAA